MIITKERVLEALEVIEKYKIQEISNIKKIENKTNKATDKRSVVCLGLETREFNCLKSAGVHTVGELLSVDRCDLRKIRNLGRKGIVMINESLKADGIKTNDFLT